MTKQNQKQPKITFQNHRHIWKTKEFLIKQFNLSDKVDVNKSYQVQNFLYQLNRIPIQEKYNIVGYGSLLNEQDIYRTAASASNHRLAYIEGWQRIFNIGYDGSKTSYMNVRKQNGSMPIAVVTISWEDLPNLIMREGLYDFHNVEISYPDEEVVITEKALMVVGDEEWEKDDILPQLNYLHLCLTGAKKLGGMKVVNEFLDTTYCYDGKTLEFINIRNWLMDLDLVSYMFNINYSSR